MYSVYQTFRNFQTTSLLLFNRGYKQDKVYILWYKVVLNYFGLQSLSVSSDIMKDDADQLDYYRFLWQVLFTPVAMCFWIYTTNKMG